VEEWSHWLTAVNVEQGKFILLDSREKKVVTIADWPTLRRRWVYHEDDEVDDTVTHTFYDLHPVVPRSRRQSQAQFSLARARALRRLTNRQLAELWDVYLGDLLVLCRTRTPLSQKVFSLGEFLRRHQEMIIEQVDFWHGNIETKAARKVLGNLHFVADTYGLVIHAEQEKRAIAGITTILASGRRRTASSRSTAPAAETLTRGRRATRKQRRRDHRSRRLFGLATHQGSDPRPRGKRMLAVTAAVREGQIHSPASSDQSDGTFPNRSTCLWSGCGPRASPSPRVHT
jgi:hypothetical protein